MKKVCKNKRALSGVISTLLIILIAFIAAGILWTVVNNIVEERTKESEACFGSFGKIEINDFYTCYDAPNQRLKFGIERKNFDLEAISVAISSESQSYTLTITEDPQTLGELTGIAENPYTSIPSKNSGTSYYLDLTMINFDTEPNSIKIAPIINGYQCDLSDTLSIIEVCPPI